MARERVAGYITKQSTNNFGLEVKVQRKTASGLYPSGDPVPEGQAGIGSFRTTDSQAYREIIPPGEFGSEEKEDLPNAMPQYVDTCPVYPNEQHAPEMHGALDSLRSGDATIPFQSYASFQPRSSPFPRARQDDGTLGPPPYQADPLMTDENSSSMTQERDANRKDLFGRNRDGVLHNTDHPGFAVVQGKIEKEGYSKKAAGAILANSTRHASAAAKKANPNLKRVKG